MEAKAKKPKALPCPKWMRHKWEAVGEETLANGFVVQYQTCVFCKNERTIEVDLKEDEGEE